MTAILYQNFLKYFILVIIKFIHYNLVLLIYVNMIM